MTTPATFAPPEDPRWLIAGALARLFLLWAPLFGLLSLALLRETGGSLLDDAALSLATFWTLALSLAILEVRRFSRLGSGRLATGAYVAAVAVVLAFATVALLFEALVAGVGPDV